MNIEDEDLRAAIARVGVTEDGEMLFLWLQRLLLETAPEAQPGALHAQNGKRMLARELMDLLSARLDEAHAGSRYDRIIIFRRPKPAASDQRRPSGAEYYDELRRAASRNPEPGPFFNSGPDAAS